MRDKTVHVFDCRKPGHGVNLVYRTEGALARYLVWIKSLGVDPQTTARTGATLSALGDLTFHRILQENGHSVVCNGNGHVEAHQAIVVDRVPLTSEPPEPDELIPASKHYDWPLALEV